MRRQAPPSHGGSAAAVCDVEGSLLRSSSCFSYFMVVALEAGSFLRALLLLLVYPFLRLLQEETRISAMTLIAFCGVRVSSFRVGATVLPKHLLEDVGEEGFHLLTKGKKKVCVSRMPKVMVEEFLSKYLRVDTVLAREMKVVSGFYTGFMEEKAAEEEALLERELSVGGALGFSGESKTALHPVFSRCQEVVAVSEAERASWRALPGEQYPEPLVFHDGRIIFRPTPLSAIAMFVWLPFGCFLSLLRVFLYLLLVLPYGLYHPVLAFTGLKYRLVPSPFFAAASRRTKPGKLFVCNHKTQTDHIFVSLLIGFPLTSFVYGVSAGARMLSPLRTAALRRTREKDRIIMAEELRRSDAVLCPEGTTCREPFVLRFSPLFAELVEEVWPVALSSRTSMFHGTTVNGRKALDPLVLLANPLVFFAGEFLQAVPAGPARRSSETANQAQAAIAGALGFRCSMLGRKDKYRYLAGNDGVYAYEAE